MIRYLKGKIIKKEEAKDCFVVVDVGGVGYRVFVSKKTFDNLPDFGNEVVLFCHFDFKENSIKLYGFLEEEELKFFEVLGRIKGIGPKIALNIASQSNLEEMKEKIKFKDEKIFENVPGIGKKKAMAIILELSDKLEDVFRIQEKTKRKKKNDDAEESLISLGFSRQEARAALAAVPKEIDDMEGKIKEALKLLGKNK